MKAMIGVMVAVLGVLWGAQAQAQTCNVTGTTIDFGTVNPLLPTDYTRTGTINVNCTTLLSLNTRVCFSADKGDTSSSIAPRAMGNGALRMQYNLYTDSGYADPWGQAKTVPPTSQQVVALLGTVASFTVYAKLPGNQTSVSTVNNANTLYVENYTSITSAKVDVQSGLLFAPNCPLTGANVQTMSIPIVVKALVQKNCTISATNMAFPAQGILNTAIPATSQINVQCTNNNAYSIALNGGTVGANVLSRKMKHATAADTVDYQLYQDPARTVIWGNGTSGTSLLNGLGNGSPQSYTVYGRVPVQTTPRAGDYKDTVTATITF